jgi:hypothetical protein
MFVYRRKQTNRPPRPFTGISLLFHVYMMCVPQRKHTYKLPWHVTEIALLFMCGWCSYLTGNTGLHGLLRRELYFFICRWCLYITRSVPMGLHSLFWGEIYFFICRWCSYLRQITCKLPWPVTERALFFYVDDVRTSQEIQALMVCYRENFTFYM